MKINGKGLNHRDLNRLLKEASAESKEIDLVNILGHRYIGTGLACAVKINIYGTPGSDLGAFMDGPDLNVYGSGQDAIGNTMNSGNIIIHGSAGNVLGYSTRGGTIMVKGSVGYRAGIHMKAFGEKRPTIIIGGSSGAFLGEYMAGGRIIVLGLTGRKGESAVGDYIATGMHGGEIFIRGPVKPYQIWHGVNVQHASDDDILAIRPELESFCRYFLLDIGEVLSEEFTKITPTSSRPYERLYV